MQGIINSLNHRYQPTPYTVYQPISLNLHQKIFFCSSLREVGGNELTSKLRIPLLLLDFANHVKFVFP